MHRLGDEHQMVLELRPAHDPRKAYGFVGVVISLEDLSSSIWVWYQDEAERQQWKAKKVIEIPAEPADPADLPPLLQGFKAVPPLVTDINLSLDDRLPLRVVLGHGRAAAVRRVRSVQPELTGNVQIGGIVRAHGTSGPADKPLNGGPQMVEVSRDGRRVYLTNSLYSPWDAQFYPDGIRGLDGEARRDARGRHGARPEFFLEMRARGCARTRCGSRAATRRRTRSASRHDRRDLHSGTALLLGAGHGINPAWAGSSPWRWGCRSAAARVWGALGPLAVGHARRLPPRSRQPRSWCRKMPITMACNGSWASAADRAGNLPGSFAQKAPALRQHADGIQAELAIWSLAHGDGPWSRTHGAARSAGGAGVAARRSPRRSGDGGGDEQPVELARGRPPPSTAPAISRRPCSQLWWCTRNSGWVSCGVCG